MKQAENFKIESFTVNHLKLKRGIYLSRKDFAEKAVLTTFDIRMKEPNNQPVMSTTVMHTIEHLGATFLRSSKDFSEKTVYFGPMGCRTGFYVIFKGDLSSYDIAPIIRDMFSFIADYSGDIPGASPIECGNYTDLELLSAKKEARIFLDEILEKLTDENLNYPK